jgi:phage terminase large subunit-like protein
MSGAEAYARWVLDPANARETGRYIKLAAQRFMDDLKRTDIYFDEVEACKMINFGERYCYQWEGDWRGLPIKFEPWQRFIFEQVYGWFYVETRLRRFEDVYVQIAKKNGKSTMCAVLMDFHLFADDRVQTPKVFTAANNEDQAKICVNMAGRIIEQSPDLADLVDDGTVKLFNYKDNITEVVHTEKDGFIKAFAKETSDKKSKTAGGKHGVNASLGVVDEFGMSPDHGASKPIKTSMAARKEGLMFKITTSGFNMDGPCYQEDRKIGIQVLEGLIKKDNYLPIIFEIDPPVGEDGKPHAITPIWLLANSWAWKQANPNIDVSVQRKFLKSMLDDAVAFGGTTEVDVLTLNFNMWVDSPEVFIPADVWNRNSHGITEEDLEGQECYGGIEIVSGKLMNAFCLIFPDVKGKTVLKPLFWAPDDYIKSSKDSDSLRDWAKAGLIKTILGSVSDNDRVYALIMDELRKYNMHSFAYKTNLENNDIVQALLKNGIEGYPISHGYQGISTPTLIWEEMFTAASMEHFSNPVLAWQNSNCLAVRKDHDIRLEKSGSRVVGIYAGINALAQWKTISAGEIPVDTEFTEL